MSDTMADWDEAKLEQVVTQKHAESDMKKPKTEIVTNLHIHVSMIVIVYLCFQSSSLTCKVYMNLYSVSTHKHL